MARVFLTGASGFLGRHLAPRLRASAHRVTSLQREPRGDRDTVHGDLAEPSSYASALAGTDVVAHLAAVTGEAPAAEYERVNVEGTRALLDAARRAGVSRFLFCSTIAVTFADTRHYAYAESKAIGEQLVQGSGMRTTTIRPTIIGGPGSAVLSRLASLATLPVIPLFGGGGTKVQPILVDDLADLVVDIVDADRFTGEILEFGGRDVLLLRDVLDRLHRQQRHTPSRFLPIPIGLLLPPLRLLEPLLGAALPMTIGQLATFRFDGVARPNPVWTARHDRLASLDRVLDQTSRA